MTKSRRVCFEPENKIFYPESGNNDFVVLTDEETEARRIADVENMAKNVWDDICNL